MRPTNNPNSQNQSPPIVNQNPRNLKCRPTTILWASAMLSLILSFALTRFSPVHPLTSHPHLLKPNLIQKIRSLVSPPPQPQPQPQPRPTSPRPPCVLWMAPFLAPGGYSSEAWSYMTSLSAVAGDYNFSFKILHHGDLQSLEFWDGLPERSKSLAYEHYNAECRLSEAIVVCHSEPGAWFPPLFQTLPCPPTGYRDPLFVVGRTMFETDRLNAEHVERCNRMDAVWVPTEFHVSTFVESGVDRSKVVKLVQPVDVEFFDPLKHREFVLGCQKPPVLGRCSDGKEFVFLSVFKWEQRKGWDVLLKAFLEEFSRADNVALHLLISSYHSDADFGAKISKFVRQFGMKEPGDGWAAVHVIDTHVPQSELPRIYKAADAFVLPSRGEGWGRPIVEAMAMALPVIATNWSGPTEYLTEENGYPLPVDEMSEVAEGPFKGHLWAEPSSEKLRVLMRRVVSDREEGRRKGRKAREDMVERFSPEVVARVLAGEIVKIMEKLG